MGLKEHFIFIATEGVENSSSKFSSVKTLACLKIISSISYSFKSKFNSEFADRELKNSDTNNNLNDFI